MRHPIKHTPGIGADIDIFTNRELLSGWVRAIRNSKIDSSGNQKDPLWTDKNRKLYSATEHSVPESFLLTFSTRTEANAYISAIKRLSETRRMEKGFIAPEVWFGFEDKEGYNIYIEVSHTLIDSTKTMLEHFSKLVLHPEWLGVKKSIKTQGDTKALVLNLLTPPPDTQLRAFPL